MGLAFCLEGLIFLEHHLAPLPSGFLLVLVNDGTFGTSEDGRGLGGRVSSLAVGVQQLAKSIDIKSQSPCHTAFLFSSGNYSLPSLFRPVVMAPSVTSPRVLL